MSRKGNKNDFYFPVFHIPSQIIFWITIFFSMVFNRCFSKIRIIGKKNLVHPAKGAILVSNHTLYFDPAIIAHVIVPHRTCFTAMEETFRLAGIGRYIRYLGAIPVSSCMPFNTLMSNIHTIFNKKQFIHFFPEGELIPFNKGINKFKNGAFILAFRFNKPVIPITIVTKPRPYLNKTLNKFFSRVTVKVNTPIYPSQFKRSKKTGKEQVRCMANYCRDIMLQDLNLLS